MKVENSFKIKESHVDFANKIIEEAKDKNSIYDNFYDFNSVEGIIQSYIDIDKNKVIDILKNNIGKSSDWLFEQILSIN